MTVATFVQLIKRKAQYGDITNTTDQITIDIVNFLNDRGFEFWRSWSWEWALFPISFNTVVGQTDYTLDSNVGGITALTAGTGGYLKRISWKRYLDWFLNNQVDPVTGISTVPANGSVTNYVRIGRDTSGNIKIRLWRPPSGIVTITGFGKQRITKYAIADIAANTVIAYFPEEVHEVLEDGVLADVYESSGQKDESTKAEKEFYGKIDYLKSTEEDNTDLDATTPPPDYYILRKRKRGGTTVV